MAQMINLIQFKTCCHSAPSKQAFQKAKRYMIAIEICLALRTSQSIWHREFQVLYLKRCLLFHAQPVLLTKCWACIGAWGDTRCTLCSIDTVGSSGNVPLVSKEIMVRLSLHPVNLHIALHQLSAWICFMKVNIQWCVQLLESVSLVEYSTYSSN